MVYVHKKIDGLTFNCVVYCLMRAWHLPNLDMPKEDTWFAVPAVKIGDVYNLINANFEYTALMMIDETGRLIKSHRVNLNLAPKVEGFELDELKRTAFNIPLWEETNQAEFPYATMFDSKQISQRFSTLGIDRTAAVAPASTNITYNKIRERVKPKPCNCGKVKVM